MRINAIGRALKTPPSSTEESTEVRNCCKLLDIPSFFAPPFRRFTPFGWLQNLTRKRIGKSWQQFSLKCPQLD